MKRTLLIIVILLAPALTAAQCMIDNQATEESYANPACYTESAFYAQSDPAQWKWEFVPPEMIPSVSPVTIEHYYSELSPPQRKEMTTQQIMLCLSQINDLTTDVDKNRAQRAILYRFNSLVDLGNGAMMRDGILHATYENKGYVRLEKKEQKQMIKIDEHGNVLLLDNKAPPADGKYTLVFLKDEDVVLPDGTKLRSKGKLSYSQAEDGNSNVYVKKDDSAFVNGVSIIQPKSDQGIRILFREAEAAPNNKEALPPESLTFYENGVVMTRSSGVQLEFDGIMATPTERRRFVLGGTKNSEDAILLVEKPIDLEAGILRKGNRGPKVELLQKRINEFLASNNINQKPIKEDGIFGKDTEEALKAMQRKLGLKADGVFGKDTNMIVSLQYLQGSIQILQDGLIYNDGKVFQVPRVSKLKNPTDNLRIDFRVPPSLITHKFLADHDDIRSVQEVINYVLLSKPAYNDRQRWQRGTEMANSLGFDLNDLVAYRDAQRSEGITNEDILIDKYLEERGDHITIKSGSTNYQQKYVAETRVVTTDKIEDIPWPRIVPDHVDENTRKEFEAMCKRVGIDPSGLAMLIKSESQWDTTKVMPSSLATGMFQFLPETAAYLLGEEKPKTQEERIRISDRITRMYTTEQIKLIEKYFQTIKRSYPNTNLKSIEDISVATFYPAALNYLPEAAIGARYGTPKQQIIYEQNKGLDKDNDFVIRRNEYGAYLKDKMNHLNKLALLKKI